MKMMRSISLSRHVTGQILHWLLVSVALLGLFGYLAQAQDMSKMKGGKKPEN